MITLRLENASGESRFLQFPPGRLQIGRTEPNDLVLPDETRKVSRVHAAFEVRATGELFVEDLGSVNGTLRNGVPLRAPAQLLPHDVLQIGPYRFTLHQDAPPATDLPLQVEEVAANLDELQESVQLVDAAAGAAEIGRLELLYEVGIKLARTNSVAEVQENAVSFLFRIAGVHRAALMLWDAEREELAAAQLIGRGGKLASSLPGMDPRRQLLSRTLLDRARLSNQPLHIRDPRSDLAFSGARSIATSGIQAALCAPLSLHGRFLGILYADNLAMPDAFTTADFQIFSVVTAQTGLALGNALARAELVQREVERASLRRYVPPHVAEVIEAAGEAQLHGQVQQVTVLFADIRGFTRLSEQMDAREVVQLLNEFFTAATEVVIAAGGILDKFIGDCVMALFGPPQPTDKDAQRAMQAALELHRVAARISSARIASGQWAPGLPGLAIGVGIHTGPAVVGNIGSVQRLQYTAIGDTVNVASRLAGRAGPCETIVSQQVCDHLAGQFPFTAIGEVALKGRNQAMHAHLHRSEVTNG